MEFKFFLFLAATLFFPAAAGAGRGELFHPYRELTEVKIATSATNSGFLGEKLLYEISWSFLTVGKASMEIDKAALINGATTYHIISKAESTSVIDYFFHVEDTNEAWISPDFAKSYGYLKKLREGDYFHDECVIFNYEAARYYGKKMDRKGRTEDFTGELPEKVLDVLSSLYHIRVRDIRGKKEIFVNVNTRKNWRMKIRFLGTETVKTDFGKRKCVKVEPLVGDKGIFVPRKGKSMYVWISDDEERLPIKLEAEIFIGSIKAELVKKISP